jgi:kanamycin nucleotidyltransferase
MNHRTRLRIAHALKRKILKKHGKQVLGIAIYGSVAKNEDRMYSDLEMFVVTKRKQAARDVRYVYKDMTVEVAYTSARTILREARRVTINWAIEADCYRSYAVLYEKNAWFKKLQRATQTQDARAFTKAIRKYVVWLHELIGKIKNAYRYHDDNLFYWLAAYLGWESLLLLGLMNKHYYKSERVMFDEVLSLPLLPQNYRKLRDVVLRFTPARRDTVYKATLALYRELKRLARTQDVVLTDKKLRV